MFKKKISSVFFYEALSFVLATLTGVLGAVPLMFLYREVGRWQFLAFNFFIAMGLIFTNNPFLWAPYLICSLLVVFYFELEYFGYLKAGFFSVLKTSLLIGGVCFFYIKSQNIQAVEWATSSLQGMVESIQKIDPSLKVDLESVVKQLPSILFTALGIAMWLAILFDRRFRGVSKLFRPEEDPFLNTRLPDGLVWLVIVALLFSFVKTPINWGQEVALNLLNVILLLYFFQGLSIVALAFTRYRLGPFIKAFLYVVFVTQLFLFVSILGILDYWLNFRGRIFKASSTDGSS